jgi:tetratricopeptide (TPR) repeat protein
MTSPVLTSRLYCQGKEYLLQTSWVETQKKIITSLFSEGKFLSQQAFECVNGIGTEESATLLKTLHQNKFQETSRLFELSEHPNGQHNEAEVRFLLGEAFYQQGLLGEAVLELKQSLETAPDNPSAVRLLAQVYLDLHDFSRAETHLAPALQRYEKYADLRLLLAETLAGLEKYSEAVKQIEQAVAINPYYAEAHFRLGLVLMQNKVRRKEFELTTDYPVRALQSLERAAQLNPDYLSPQFQQGLESLRNGNSEEALKHLTTDSVKNRDRYRNYLHEYYLKYIAQNGALDEKSLSRQIKSLQKLVEQNPAYADLRFQLGTIYMLLCRYITQKAVLEYGKALQLNPDYKKAQRNMKLCENDLKGIDLLLKAML